MRKLFCFLLLLAAATVLPAQTYTQGYTQIVVFGDSLSDTGNFARTVQNGYAVRVPGPMFGYTDGRFTDGADTSPAARLYTGVWAEQLAAVLTPVPAVKASLDGGTDYAYGDATNAAGSQNVAVAAGVNVTIQNVGAQIATYLATRPVITPKTLFIVWGGANDLLQATSAAQITTAAQLDLANIQTLVAAGATQFLIPNLPPLGAIPRLNGVPANAATATAGAAAYNAAINAGLNSLSLGANIRIYQLDIFSLFSAILPSPAITGFANISASAQGMTTINPDTYLFWDDLHPTTYGHYLISRAARNLFTQTLLSGTTLTLSTNTASPAQTVTLTAHTGVAVSPAIATGLMTFYSGTTPIATVLVDGTGSATTTISASLAASPYTLTARYSGDATFTSSVSLGSTLTVAAPGFTLSASPSTVVTQHGTLQVAGTTVISMASTGNLAGTFNPSCGTLPAYVSCSFSNALQVNGNSTAVTTLSFSTAVSAANQVPSQPGSMPALPVFIAFIALGGVGFGVRRRWTARPALFGVLGLLLLAGVTTLTGCGGSGTAAPKSAINYAAAGTYTIPVNVTPAVSGSNGTINVTLVIQ